MASAMAQNERYTFFWKSHSPFSQWHHSVFDLDGVKYTCAEQFMMHRKAVLFDDPGTAQEVLRTDDPKKMKALGRKVQNFNQQLWDDACKEVVKAGNLAKFSQNEHLKKKLFATEGTTLAEASPVDRIWGIGLAADNPKAHHKRLWRGKNLLGYILTQVRDELMLQEAKKMSLKNGKKVQKPKHDSDHNGQIKYREKKLGGDTIKIEIDVKLRSGDPDSKDQHGGNENVGGDSGDNIEQESIEKIEVVEDARSKLDKSTSEDEKSANEIVDNEGFEGSGGIDDGSNGEAKADDHHDDDDEKALEGVSTESSDLDDKQKNLETQEKEEGEEVEAGQNDGAEENAAAVQVTTEESTKPENQENSDD